MIVYLLSHLVVTKILALQVATVLYTVLNSFITGTVKAFGHSFLLYKTLHLHIFVSCA